MGQHAIEATPPINTQVSDDADLILILAAARSCDSPEFHDAWRKLVERYERRVFSVARHVAGPNDAEEVVQETFLSFFQTVRKNALPRHSIAGWLCTVAVRKAIHMSTRRRNERREILRMQQNRDSDQEQPAYDAQMEEARQVVANLVGTLPEKLRIPMTLYFTANLPQTDIARELECSQVTVSTRINEALDLLRSGLRKAGYTALPASWTVLLAIERASHDASLLARCHQKLLKVPSRATKSRRHRPRKTAPNQAPFVVAACALIAGVSFLALQAPTASTLPTSPTPLLPTVKPLIVRTSTPPQAKVSAPVVEPAPLAIASVLAPAPAPALVYEDTFDGAALDPFWSMTVPSQKAGCMTWSIDRVRGLELVAGGASAKDAESGAKFFPKVELISKPIELDQRPIEIDIDLVGLLSAGPCVIGVDIADEAGNSIVADPVKKQTQPAIQLLRMRATGNTPPVNHFIVDNLGRFARTEADGSISILDPIPRSTKIKSLTLHISVIAIGDASTARWYSKHMRVIRLNSWPN